MMFDSSIRNTKRFNTWKFIIHVAKCKY